MSNADPNRIPLVQGVETTQILGRAAAFYRRHRLGHRVEPY
jgi:hypothetical protein